MQFSPGGSTTTGEGRVSNFIKAAILPPACPTLWSGLVRRPPSPGSGLQLLDVGGGFLFEWRPFLLQVPGLGAPPSHVRHPGASPPPARRPQDPAPEQAPTAATLSSMNNEQAGLCGLGNHKCERGDPFSRRNQFDGLSSSKEHFTGC